MTMSALRRRAIIAGLAMLLSAGCGSADERLAKGRDMIRSTLRYPAVAEFRNERVRTLWSDNGDRLVVYCGELSAANDVGRTRFMSALAVVDASTKQVTGRKFGFWPPGVAMTGASRAEFYMMCERTDTQRKTGTLFLSIYPYHGRIHDPPAKMTSEMDARYPPISLDGAPR